MQTICKRFHWVCRFSETTDREQRGSMFPAQVFLEEEDLHFYTLIDASMSMDFGDPTKLMYAKKMAAALGYIGLCRSDRVKIETLGQPARHPSEVLRGRHSLWRMLKVLNGIEPGENESLSMGIKNFCLRNSGKGILVLITDLLDKNGYETALRFLIAQQLDVYIMHVLSPTELDPDVKGDLRLIDCEDADVADITVSRPLLDRYRRTLAAFVDGAQDFCNRREISYMLVSTETPVQQLVSSYLRRRGLVR